MTAHNTAFCEDAVGLRGDRTGTFRTGGSRLTRPSLRPARRSRHRFHALAQQLFHATLDNRTVLHNAPPSTASRPLQQEVRTDLLSGDTPGRRLPSWLSPRILAQAWRITSPARDRVKMPATSTPEPRGLDQSTDQFRT